MNKPMPVNPPGLRSIIVATSSMPWQPTQFAGIEMKILYSDDEGRSTILFKMAPGAVVPLHEHTALEQTFMLEGSLEDAEGSCGAGDFVWRPGGNIHVAHAPNGAPLGACATWMLPPGRHTKSPAPQLPSASSSEPSSMKVCSSAVCSCSGTTAPGAILNRMVERPSSSL